MDWPKHICRGKACTDYVSLWRKETKPSRWNKNFVHGQFISFASKLTICDRGTKESCLGYPTGWTPQLPMLLRFLAPNHEHCKCPKSEPGLQAIHSLLG